MSFIIYEGKITIKEPDGKISEYESFIVTKNPDGSRTMRTLTRSPKGDLLRDVNQREDKNWRPLEAVGRLYFKNELKGTVLRKIVKELLHSWIWHPDGVIDYKTFDAPKNLTVGFHPIFHEAWKMNFLSTEHDEKQSIITHTVSNTWNGSTIDHGVKLESFAKFDGNEDISVAAGRFNCRRYTWYTPFGKELIIWCHGEDNIFVKELVYKGDKAGTVYELCSLVKKT